MSEKKNVRESTDYVEMRRRKEGVKVAGGAGMDHSGNSFLQTVYLHFLY
jgi:hypothetical protein